MTTPFPQKDCYRLFVDESGTGDPRDTRSDVYILAGCSVHRDECAGIKTRADQIKFKYWGRTDIVFHSRDIGRREGDFSILKTKRAYDDFVGDLGAFLTQSKYKMFFIVVDKEKARAAGWNRVKVYEDTSLCLIRHFLLILLASDARGEITVESATAEKDIHILRSFGFFMAAGLERPRVNHEVVQDILTSVSFVTKQNHDIEEQIADLFGYAARLKYTKTSAQTGYDLMILEALNKKIYKVPRGANASKAKFLNEVEPFLVLP